MAKDLLMALKISFFTLLLTGFLYPLLITGISYVVFPKRSAGSFLFDEKKNMVGSELIGQNFQNPAYFFPRPSHAGGGYNGLRSGGSNLGPTSKELMANIRSRIEKLKGLNTAPIPLSLLASSASGLDPHISVQGAYWQAPNIALKRDVSLKRIISIIDNQIIFPQFYILGYPRLNVLKLNLALDQFFGPPLEVK